MQCAAQKALLSVIVCSRQNFNGPMGYLHVTVDDQNDYRNRQSAQVTLRILPDWQKK